MLVSLKFSNFRSYYNEQLFSMIANPQEKNRYFENSFAVDSGLYKGRLLKSSMILGVNGSGKTNLLSVAKYLRYLVLFSSEASRDKRNIFIDANEQFAFFESAKNIPTTFEIEFIVENKFYYIYKLQIKNFEVEYECLYRRDISEGKRLSKIKCLYERNDNNLINVSDDFKKLVEFVEIKPNVLLISNCNSDIKDDVCPSGKMIIKWFNDLHYWTSSTSSIEIYDTNEGLLDKAELLLKASDKSLKALKLEKTKLDVPIEDQNDPKSVIKALKKSNIDLDSGIIAMLDDGIYKININAEYHFYDNPINKNIKDTVKFSVFDSSSKISTGQAKLIKYFAYIIEVLQNGGILFLDELDSNLHHQFPKLITDAFNDDEINTHNAQLIFTTHSANLLNNNFRRDQINIVFKDKYGISSAKNPERINARVKNTNSLSKLWLENELNVIENITIEDLKEILLRG